MKETTLNRTISVPTVKEAAIWIAKQIVIAIAVGISYFTLCVINPFGFLAGVHSLTNFVNIRWANLLRPLVMIAPGAAAGISYGAWQYNIYNGKASTSAFYASFMPQLNFVLGGLAFAAWKLWAKGSWKKELAIVAAYGAATGYAVTLNLRTWAAFTQGVEMSEILALGISWKFLTHIAVPIIGYLIIKKSGLQKSIRRFIESRSTK